MPKTLPAWHGERGLSGDHPPTDAAKAVTLTQAREIASSATAAAAAAAAEHKSHHHCMLELLLTGTEVFFHCQHKRVRKPLAGKLQFKYQRSMP